MLARLAQALVACVVVGTLVCGCAARIAPRGWLPYAQEAQHEAYGGWIHLQYGERGVSPDVTGELLAISDDSVFVLSGSMFAARALASVPRAQLEAYDSRSHGVAQMTLGGTLSTITHGFGLILTAPLWVLTGSVSSGKLSHQALLIADSSRPGLRAQPEGHTRWGRASWKDMRLYARFPQGMPPGLDRSQLRERPRTKREQRTRSWPGSIVEHSNPR